MKKYLAILFGVFLLVALSGIVYAANENAAVAAKTTEKVTEKSTEDLVKSKPVAKNISNMTYGQCVSQQAEMKNSCYASVKEARDTCNDQAAQSTAKKDATKQCKQTYKKDLKQCKTAFKASKKECAKIKHNFFETMSVALK